MSNFNRNELAVVDVAMALHGDACGSGDSIEREDRRRMLEWLAWRIRDGWRETEIQRFKAFDDAVRNLAWQALRSVEAAACDHEWTEDGKPCACGARFEDVRPQVRT